MARVFKAGLSSVVRSRTGRGRWHWPALGSLAVVACTFPEYTFQDQAANQADAGQLSITSSSGTLTSGSGGVGSGAASAGGAAASDSSLGSGTGTLTSGGGQSTSTSSGSLGGSAGVSGSTTDAGDTTSGSGGTGIDIGTCSNDGQCQSAQCDRGSCRPAHCGNGVMDADESDTDCGGSACRGCGFGLACQRPEDCASGGCGASGACAATLRVRCSCDSQGACELEPERVRVALQFENLGAELLGLEALTFHYYYSGDLAAEDSVSCNAVNLDGGSCDNLTLEPLKTGFAVATASHEVRFRFGAGQIPSQGMTGAVEFTIAGNAPYERSDDYSFQGVPTDSSNFVPCDRVVVSDRDGVPIWGVPPAP